ncbi:MAG TPA: CatA-like O-acetyltransferase [Burkholderiaceae bacterium]|nr:CatA-like O-acetyltransferase [Burkholderiaceae bacterium]
MGRTIDLANWKRAQHYAFYKDFQQPFFSVNADVDVSALRRACQAPGGASFFLASLFLSLQAANGVEAFRLRIRNEAVWLHDEVHAGSTILLPDDTFTFATFPLVHDFGTFQSRGQEEIRRRTAAPGLAAGAGGDELIHYSVLPWIHFTSFTNALHSAADSVPKIVFGKYRQQGGNWRMPVSVQVHHALVDGIDVARFLEGFQERLDDPRLLGGVAPG